MKYEAIPLRPKPLRPPLRGRSRAAFWRPGLGLYVEGLWNDNVL